MIALIALTLTALAQQNAGEIIEQAKQTQKVDNSIQQIRMVLVSRSGAERVRELEMRIRRDGEVLSSYTRFSHPSDVSGTQLIVVDSPDSLDEQLLYLPALKRVQRIAGRARTGSFMGSDFAYEDLEISGADAAQHTLVSEDAEVWIIDTIPGPDSSYSRIRTAVSKADYLPRKVEYFDKKGAPLKVLTVEETAMDGETVIPVRSVMHNLQKGTTTRLEILEHQLNVTPEQIPDETFTASFMERNG
ncbi:MAG: outer membrane lipoprotein-sorting protein [Myxococcota bacterium]|jgi:outer membrane lipoprotein-sorting protein